MKCTKVPGPWKCTRERGHHGPCAPRRTKGKGRLILVKDETCVDCVFFPLDVSEGECGMCEERNLWRRRGEPASDLGDDDPDGPICPLFEPRPTEPEEDDEVREPDPFRRLSEILRERYTGPLHVFELAGALEALADERER